MPYWWLKCMFWTEDEKDDVWIVQKYRKFLEWDLMQNPWITRILEKCLNPVLGKSIVMYYVKYT